MLEEEIELNKISEMFRDLRIVTWIQIFPPLMQKRVDELREIIRIKKNREEILKEL